MACCCAPKLKILTDKLDITDKRLSQPGNSYLSTLALYPIRDQLLKEISLINSKCEGCK